MTTNRCKRILILENESLLGASIECILKNDIDLKVSGLSSFDRGTLVNEIMSVQPDVLILENICHLFDLAKFVFLMKEIPKLRLIVISAADNSFQIYDKHEVFLTDTTDLITAIRYESTLTL